MSDLLEIQGIFGYPIFQHFRWKWTFSTATPVINNWVSCPEFSHTIATMPTYSISVRLRRTKVEYAFVSVPIDEEVLERDPVDNTKLKIKPEKLGEVAKRLGTQGSVLWAQEGGPLIELHPLQTAPP